MPSYLVKYSIGKNNEYVYPRTAAGVVWKSIVYHCTEHQMIGETDDDVQDDGKEVIALTSDEARKLENEYRSTHPEPEESRKETLPPRES